MDVHGHIFRKPNNNINTLINERWNEVHRKGEREEEDHAQETWRTMKQTH